MSRILFSKASDEWQTPWVIFHALNEEFKFTLDAAATADNRQCMVYYSKDNDGLTHSWQEHVVWCNPPYSNIKAWVEKAAEEQENGTTTVMLIPARTDTRWFHAHIYRKRFVDIRFIKGRLKFSRPKLPTEHQRDHDKMLKNSAPFPSMIVIFKGR